MKPINIILAAVFLWMASGCLVKSIHPFYKENELLFNKELLGTWTGNDSVVWKIEQSTEFRGFMKPGQPKRSYDVTFTDKKGTSKFQAHLFKLNNILFFDFFPLEWNGPTDLMDSHLVPMHTVARVELSPGRLTIRWYDEEWLISLFKQNKIRIAHEKIPNDEGSGTDKDFQVVLTASTDELQKFLLKYSDDPKAFMKEFTFVLTKSESRRP